MCTLENQNTRYIQIPKTTNKDNAQTLESNIDRNHLVPIHSNTQIRPLSTKPPIHPNTQIPQTKILFVSVNTG